MVDRPGNDDLAVYLRAVPTFAEVDVVAASATGAGLARMVDEIDAEVRS